MSTVDPTAGTAPAPTLRVWVLVAVAATVQGLDVLLDRKSTRLNSSHT